ncbi:MAG TPA: ATP-binding protein [Aggregatilinea sp.]|uniref:sensor histidine kinase n=1 Tax=Aggregatilinea sp. TaxID=2806333 RepID=UPI002CB3EBB8|nr:ATP-binding protein [Aggregatilinea sp.]HML23776.1 ATP-binding protein [Aggregatilinea sp.]
MLHSLRTRLLASYVAILLIMLCLIGLVLLLFLRTRPLPTDTLIRDLTGTLLDVRVTEVVRLEGRLNNSVTAEVSTLLSSEAAARDFRLMVVNEDNTVEFDSNETFDVGTALTEVDREPLVRPTASRTAAIYQGRFLDPDGTEWIYVAQPLRPVLVQRANTPFLAVAAPVPRPSLRSVVQTFGETFFRPLVRAGMLGLLVAIGLSALIARSVARPLQQMSKAAQRIADGDLEQRVPVVGPHEVRTLAQSFNEMTEKVATTQNAQRDFLANVSHDLRTPLTSIQGFSQAIAEGVASDPEAARHAAQIIHDEAGRLHRMVESLLDLARIESGQMEMQRRPLWLGDVLHAVAESISMRARDKGVQLDVQIPPTLPRVAGDGDRLAQVFTNLLDNAIRYTPAGGRVTLDATATADALIVTMRDTGEGIPAAELSRIFERFYQVDKSRQRGRRTGSGLGLAISQQIVEAHGGRIEVASVEGSGTTFTVRLPRPAEEG